jgi:transcriptional regulator with XRE-family HTH domain
MSKVWVPGATSGDEVGRVHTKEPDTGGRLAAVTTLEDLGRYLHELRDKAKVTQESLSTKAGALTGHKLSRSRISEIENSKRDPVTEQELRGYMRGLKCAPRHIDQAVTVLRQCTAPDGDSTGTNTCPYPGLAAFGPRQAHWFFGRTQVTADLVARLDERLGGGELLAVVAPSGAGKSSLLAAGLIPALAGGALPGSRDWPVVVATPGSHPLATLVDRVTAETGADPAAAAVVAGDPDRFAAFLTRVVADSKPEKHSLSRIVLIIDQFEEIFTECQEETERQAFITALCAAGVSPAVVVVLGVRADFYGQCLGSRAVSAALHGHLPLEPMSADQLREVMTKPRADRMRQIVAPAGLAPWRCWRWKAIVAAPASCPSRSRSLRSATTSSSSSWAVRCGLVSGRRDRGSKPA